MRFVVKVSKRGQIVIPAEIRRMFNIRDRVVIRVDGEVIKVIPFTSLEELFGVDGDVMKVVAREIVEERVGEVKHGI